MRSRAPAEHVGAHLVDRFADELRDVAELDSSCIPGGHALLHLATFALNVIYDTSTGFVLLLLLCTLICYLHF